VSLRRVLVGCENSGEVRDAFAARGWDAWSCDLVPSETIGQHHRCDVFEALERRGPWNLAILHPPCTFLCVSGLRWLRDDAKARPEILTGAARRRAQQDSLEFVARLWATCDRLGIPHALENPIGLISSHLRKPTQIIQPWQFGHTACKATCLWLTGLPRLEPTRIVAPTARRKSIWKEPPGPWQARNRSRTFRGIALAMAAQWDHVAAPALERA